MNPLCQIFSSGTSDNEVGDATKGAAKIEPNQSEVIKVEEVKTEAPKPKRHISKLISFSELDHS